MEVLRHEGMGVHIRGCMKEYMRRHKRKACCTVVVIMRCYMLLTAFQILSCSCLLNLFLMLVTMFHTLRPPCFVLFLHLTFMLPGLPCSWRAHRVLAQAIKMLVDTHAEVDYECANGCAVKCWTCDRLCLLCWSYTLGTRLLHGTGWEIHDT